MADDCTPVTSPRSPGDLEAGVALHPPAPVHLHRDSAFESNIQISSALERRPPSTSINLRRRRQLPKKPPQPQPETRKEPAFFSELQRRLEDPPAASLSFFCWEDNEHGHRVVPLLIDDPEDEKKIYQDLRRAWRERCPWWKRTPFYGEVGLEEVELHFLGIINDEIFAVIKKFDLAATKAKFMEELARTEGLIERLLTPSSPIWCYENPARGLWDHVNENCRAISEPVECAFETFEKVSRMCARLGLLALLFLCFQHPNKAVHQRTLEGMAQESSIYKTSIGTSDALKGHRPRVAEKCFRGLEIVSGWKTKCVRCTLSIVTVIGVILWKASGGSWQNAIAAGAFFVTLWTLSSRRV